MRSKRGVVLYLLGMHHFRFHAATNFVSADATTAQDAHPPETDVTHWQHSSANGIQAPQEGAMTEGRLEDGRCRWECDSVTWKCQGSKVNNFNIGIMRAADTRAMLSKWWIRGA